MRDIQIDAFDARISLQSFSIENKNKLLFSANTVIWLAGSDDNVKHVPTTFDVNKMVIVRKEKARV